MKIKILKSSEQTYWYCDLIGDELEVNYCIEEERIPFRAVTSTRYIKNSDAVITELPESFCVKRCDDNQKWKKYIDWLNKTYHECYNGFCWMYYGLEGKYTKSRDEPFGTEIHIDDIIKHIDYLENNEQEFDLTTLAGRIYYTQKYYPIGTKYIPLNSNGISYGFIKEINIQHKYRGNSISGGYGFIYANGKWAEIIKEDGTIETNLLELIRLFPELPTDYAKKLVQKTLEVKDGWLNSLAYFIGSADTPKTFYEYIIGSNSVLKADYVWRKIYDFKNKKLNMETQKLSRQGLKEIHSVACSTWKETLEQFGRRNPLEDYIELSQDEINIMFDACTKEQLPIVSKYLKKDDSSIDIMKFKCEIYDKDGRAVIEKRCDGEYSHKSLLLDDVYDWEIKKDSKGMLCLIPTKKK